MRLVALLAGALLLAGCGGKADDPFAFDSSQPLDVRVARQANVSGVRLTDLSYAGPNDRIHAWLAAPADGKRHPAVVFLHGAGGSRDNFMTEAVLMAQQGVVGMAITSAYERSTDVRVHENTEPVSVDRQLEIRSVVDVRRALQLLRERKDVDPKRIGLLGYSRGAQWAALAAAVEHPRAVVLMGALARPSQGVYPAKDRHLVVPLDTVRWVGRIAPGELLVQGGRYDDVATPAAAKELYAAARKPKRLAWYETGHEFEGQTLDDQLSFLLDALR